MPVDPGTGSRPPKRRKKTAPRPPSRQARIAAGNAATFVPKALVPPPPIRNPDVDKAGTATKKFTVKATPAERRRAREVAAEVEARTKAGLAIQAPVSIPARVDLRSRETEAERKFRVGSVPLVQPPSRRRIRPAATAARFLGDVGKAAASAAGEAVAEGLLGAAWGGAEEDTRGPVRLPLEARAAVAGAKAAVTPAVWMTTGPDLMNAIVGLPHSKGGLAFDLAMLPAAAGGRPIRAVKAGVAGAKAAKRGAKLEEIGDIASEVYRQRRNALVMEKKLSAAHGRALDVYNEADQAFKKAVTQAKLKGKITAGKKGVDPEVARLKQARLTAKMEVLYQKMRATSTWKPPGREDPRFDRREAIARDLIRTFGHRKSALPPKASVTQIRNLFTFLDELTEKGTAGRMWYENSARAILEMTNGDTRKAEQFAQLLAIYSPQQPIIGNTSLAIRAWNEFMSAAGEYADTGKVTTGQVWQRKAAERVLSGTGDWEGRKTNNFYVNFLEDIDKAKFDQLVAEGAIRPDGVTIDIWMARVFGYADSDVDRAGRYDVMETITKEIAAERGWKPKQVQAAIWTAIKDASDDVTANIDFSEGIARHFGQFNFEAATGGDFGRVYSQWDPDLQQKFMVANGHLVDDFLSEVGFLHEPGRLGAGVYGGPDGVEFNPAVSARFLTSAAPRVPGAQGAQLYQLHPVERAQIERAAAAIGQALEQESVAWLRPSAPLTKGHADTIHLPLGRAGTSEEAQALWRALNGDTEQAFIINAADGFYVKSAGALPPLGKDGFHAVTMRAANEVFPDATGTPKLLASDGGLVESQDYGLHLATAGDRAGSGGDARFAAAADLLAREAADLRERFVRVAASGDELAGAGRAGAVDPAARLAELEDFVRPYAQAVDDVYGEAVKAGTPLAQKLTEAMDEIAVLRANEAARVEAEFMEMPHAYQLEKTREAEGWLDRLRTAVQEESAALGLLPIAGVDDAATLGASSVAAVGGLAVARRGIARSRARGLHAPYTARTLRVNEMEQQLPRARSLITQAGERMVDKASRSLDKTWVAKTPGARIVTASARVAKHAGRRQRQELHRRPARIERELRTVMHVEEGSFEDVAHFWYAQLPEGFRNAEGLRFVRTAQQEELDAITSGQALAALEEREEALRAAQRAAETGSQAMRILNEIEQVRILKTDLPQRAQDVGASIAKLDQLIAHAPPVRQDLIDALDTIARDRTAILIRSGRLSPERAADRQSLVSEWLGLEPDGSEIYMGHRLPRQVDTRATVAGMAAGTGRVTSPKGVGSRNRLVLATTGRVRPSVHVALEDWTAGQMFESANIARDELARMGSKFENRYREGYTLINPKGRTIPAHWRTDELAAFSEGADDTDAIRELAQDVVNSFTARNRGDWDRLVEEAAEQGVKWDELRIVPNYLVDRYYSQFRSFKGRSTPGVAYDMAVDFFATSIVFARIGYIPKNVVQNLLISVPHQGAFLPINAVRAAQVLADPELRYLLKAEVGFSGASQALSSESATRGPTKWALGKVAGFVGSVADDPARMSAFLHEAAAEGVISRVNPILTEKDRRALKALLTQKSQRQRLEDIRSRSTDAMADFTRMTPDQARIARRFLIIPGWLMAGTRYPFHFAATHPIRSALMAYIAMGEPYAPEELQFNNRVDTYFSGSDYLQGIDTPWGRERTSSLLPVTTPYELGAAVAGSARGKTGPFDFETPTAIDVANPGIVTGIEWAMGEGDLERTAKRLLPGTYSLGKDLISPPTDPPRYPEDVSRIGRLKREIGILPIEVNDELDDDLVGDPIERPGAKRGRAPRPGAPSRAPRP